MPIDDMPTWCTPACPSLSSRRAISRTSLLRTSEQTDQGRRMSGTAVPAAAGATLPGQGGLRAGAASTP
eukprot:scaffold92169_cov67-Phaeocystis_antarctica.AAC.5